ncbi:IS1 family transposase [Candidatus Woesearchaeota archaeon]|nr:IS1 family transposase [Candidatus Woesearchaeota archaeon]
METRIKCVYCKASHYIKWGNRKTENRGIIQKYHCLDCGKYFTNDDGFYRMRNSEEKITAAIDLYFSNLSSRKVRNHFRRHWNHNASHMSILDWCRRYTLKVQKYVATIQPQLSGQFYMDETEIDRGRGNDVFWCNVDWGTRFINATMYSPHNQTVEDAATFLKATVAKGLPKYIQTDAGAFYPQAFQKTFYSNKVQGLTVEHRIQNYHKTGKHNVRIETVFMKVKDRVDDFRGLKALWSAPILMQGIILQHNFIEAHTTTGKIPAELAGLSLNVGLNRWLGLIRLSVQNRKE